MGEIKILVVDDSPSMRQLLSSSITQMGYQNVMTLCDGAKAVKIFESKKIDLVFLELDMPGLSGMDTFKKIKQLCATTYVVIISSASTADNVKQAFTLGASGFIVKPFNLHMIEDALAQFEKYCASSQEEQIARQDRLRAAMT